MKTELTAVALRKLPRPESGRLELTDTKCRGLNFRYTAKGERTWSIRLKVHGRDRRFVLGHYPAMSLSDARDTAGRLRAEVTAGRDPVAERREARQAALVDQATSVSEVLHRYADLHLAKLKDESRRHNALKRALKIHMARPMAELTKTDLQAMVDDKARKTPVAANRLLAGLSHFAGWAHRRGYLEVNIGERLEKPHRETGRDRVLTLEELAAIWDASEKLGPLWGGYIRLLMLTAQRRGDVAGMRWEELEGDRWVIPGSRTKNGKPHIVHLSAPAVAELEGIREDAERAKGLIFTTTGKTPISGFGRFKERLDELSGVTGWTLHDLRTAFASHCAEAGVSESVVDRVLNHVATGSRVSAVARVYQRSELLPQRAQALERWAGILLRAAGEPLAGQVVRLGA
ncbi:site-specific recombinase XerD [Aliiruegeria haliotis]|uniref:Site-specific recombinase XerD n=1 Tax=Aliiruegeria haliotis TaxID=1280846 RepID=A0A2T0RPU9_9RHOB|nr:site-specific integrase [Aliiruegeria haliotis]PRY23157.1 site-specific recombinase XerD [Aliiruegeria haliotis]